MGRLERTARVATGPAKDLIRLPRARLRSCQRSTQPEFGVRDGAAVAVPEHRLMAGTLTQFGHRGHGDRGRAEIGRAESRLPDVCGRNRGSFPRVLRLILWWLDRDPRRPVDFSHGFEQQILQGRVKIVSHKHSVAGGVSRSMFELGMSRLKSIRPRHNTACFSPGTVLAMASACATLISRMPGASSTRCKGTASCGKTAICERRARTN